MKKQLLHSITIFSILFAISFQGNGQNAVINLNFDGYMGTEATVPSGFHFSWNSATSFYTSAGNYGVSAPSFKFGNDSNFIVTPMVVAADSLSFWSKGNGSPFSPLNELRIYHSADSITWILDHTFVPLSASGNTMSISLPQLTGYFKIEYYKAPAGGNLAFDDLKIYSNVLNSITENTNVETITVYPTPTTGNLNIRLQNSNSVLPSVEVFDMLGNKVSGITVEKKGKNVFAIDLSGRSKGFYFVKIQTSTQFITKRVTLSN